jgi:hypothetical protein
VVAGAPLAFWHACVDSSLSGLRPYDAKHLLQRVRAGGIRKLLLLATNDTVSDLLEAAFRVLRATVTRVRNMQEARVQLSRTVQDCVPTETAFLVADTKLNPTWPTMRARRSASALALAAQRPATLPVDDL